MPQATTVELVSDAATSPLILEPNGSTSNGKVSVLEYVQTTPAPPVPLSAATLTYSKRKLADGRHRMTVVLRVPETEEVDGTYVLTDEVFFRVEATYSDKTTLAARKYARDRLASALMGDANAATGAWFQYAFDNNSSFW